MRVVIADDHYLVREGTRQILKASGEVSVLATVANADELLAAVRDLEPDVAIVDIRMPPGHGTEGIEAARRIIAEHPGVGVLVLSQHNDPHYAFELFRDGTDGLAYLLKSRIGDVEELVRALGEVAAGRSVVDPRIVEGLVALRRARRDSGLDRLTPREAEVLSEMAQGRTNPAIADRLGISQSAIEKHVASIFVKLDLPPDDAGTDRRVAAVLRFLGVAEG